MVNWWYKLCIRHNCLPHNTHTVRTHCMSLQFIEVHPNVLSTISVSRYQAASGQRTSRPYKPRPFQNGGRVRLVVTTVSRTPCPRHVRHPDPFPSNFIIKPLLPVYSHGRQRRCDASGARAERGGQRKPRRGTNGTGRGLSSRDIGRGIQQGTSFSAAPKREEVLSPPRAHPHQSHAPDRLATVGAVFLTATAHSPMALELPTELRYRGHHLRNNRGGDAYTSR